MKLSRFKGVFLPAICSVIAVWLYAQFCPYGLAFNKTPSIPEGLYFTKQVQQPPGLGDIACFAYVAPEWAKSRRYLYKGELICKYVLAVPGERIYSRSGTVHACNDKECRSLGKVRDSDSRGRPLAVRSWNGEALKTGEFWMGALNIHKSFDSRYLGPIKSTSLVKTMHPLITH